MRLSTEQAHARLVTHSHGVLATLHPEHGPDPQPVVYAVSAPTARGPAYVGVPIDAVKPKSANRLQREANLAADPRAALLVEHWETADWSRLWWVKARLLFVPEPSAGLVDELAGRLAGSVAQYADRPFHRILVAQVVGVSGWAAAGEQ